MRNPTNSLAVLAALLVLGGRLEAQEKKDEGKMTFDDLRKGLTDLEKKEDKQKEEKRNEIIRRNNQETLAIYNRALRKRDGDLQNVVRRLQVNQGLVKKYTEAMERSRRELALLRARYVSRTLALKNSLEVGKISKEAYAKLLEADKERFRNRESELQEDIVFYSQELEVARNLVAELTLKKELLQFDPFEPNNPEVGGEKDKRGLAERIKAKVKSVARYQDLSVVDTFE